MVCVKIIMLPPEVLFQKDLSTKVTLIMYEILLYNVNRLQELTVDFS